MVNRRELFAGAGAGIAIGGALGAGGLAAAEPSPSPPDLSFLKDSALVDADRARSFMAAEGLDALVVAHPANVFYLSNHWPQLDRMGFTESAIAVWPRDARRPLALIMHAFLYYYTHSPESDFEGRLVFPYTQPTGAPAAPGAEPPAQPARGLRVADPALLTPKERARQAALDSAKPASADASWALAKALGALGLDDAVLGIDHPMLEPLVRSRGIDATLRPAENTLRRIRMAKSPVELKMMRLAARQNMEAAMAAARQARELGSTRALRAAFFAEAARRGNDGVFMVVNGTSSEVVEEDIREGMALSIDCVSACRFYHGDFARTIFVGEPNARMRKACEGIATAWRDIRAELKAGLRFADVTRIGRESIRKQGLDLTVSFRPHSVGLFHTDHPQPSLIEPRGPEDLVLEENMILSVDCPVLQAGMGGTAHLEDLMWIRADGAEPIHATPPGVVVV